MKTLQEFHKLHGCGNDFIIVDIRSFSLSIEQMHTYARTLCRPHFSIGADGIVFIDNPTDEKAAYKWHFYNADGSRAGMCGNASRCVAFIAYSLHIAPKEHFFQTDVGLIHAVVHPEHHTVTTQLTTPLDPTFNQEIVYKGTTYTFHTVNTGVPHTVIFVNDVLTVPVSELGAYIRNHHLFAPAGTNVNFVQILDDSQIIVRTFERGVEAETYACGTGAVASVYIAHALGFVKESTKIITTSKELLHIYLQGKDVFLNASVVNVFKGFLL